MWVIKIDYCPGHDRVYAMDMLEKGIQCYTPLKDDVNHGKLVRKPLFTGYAFIALREGQHISEAKYSRVFKQAIKVADQAGLRRELREVEKLILLDPTLRLARRFYMGQAVKVLSGVFMGMEGPVEWINGKRLRMQVRLATMGTSVVVDLPASALEPM